MKIQPLDEETNAFLASPAAQVDHPLIGRRSGRASPATGMLLSAPARETGNLLAHRFADATEIARAQHVGLVRYG